MKKEASQERWVRIAKTKSVTIRLTPMEYARVQELVKVRDSGAANAGALFRSIFAHYVDSYISRTYQNWELNKGGRLSPKQKRLLHKNAKLLSYGRLLRKLKRDAKKAGA